MLPAHKTLDFTRPADDLIERPGGEHLQQVDDLPEDRRFLLHHHFGVEHPLEVDPRGLVSVRHFDFGQCPFEVVIRRSEDRPGCVHQVLAPRVDLLGEQCHHRHIEPGTVRHVRRQFGAFDFHFGERVGERCRVCLEDAALLLRADHPRPLYQPANTRNMAAPIAKVIGSIKSKIPAWDVSVMSLPSGVCTWFCAM